VLIALACTSKEERLVQHQQRAEAYYEKEQWSEAKIELMNLLQLDPDNAGAHFKMAETLWNLQEYAEAIWQYKEAVRLAPESAEYGMRYAQVAFLARDYDAVVGQLNTLLKTDPNSLDALILRGRVARLRGNPDQELADLERVLKIDPKHSTALALKAQVLAAQGDLEGAEATLQRLVDFKPVVTSHVLYGLFLSTQDRSDDALAQYEAAVQAAEDPEQRARARLLLVNFHLNQRNPEAAEQQLLAAHEEQPDSAAILLTLAQFYAMRGQGERAEEMLEARVEKLPNDATPLLVLADFHRRMGKHERALETVDRALAVDPRSELARLRKAEYLLGMTGEEPDPERMAEAKRLVAEVLEENPNSLPGLFTEAKFLLAEKSYEEAATRLRRVIDEQPSGNAHVLLGSAYLQLGQNELARGELLRALQLDANNQVARTQLAVLYLRTGERALADQQAQAALERQPGDTRLLMIRTEALTGLGRKDEALEVLRTIKLDESSTDQLRLDMANLYRRNGELADARRLLEDVAGQADDPALIAELVRIEVQGGNTEGAIALLSQGIEQNPDEASFYELRGGLYQTFRSEGKLQFSKEAERDLQTAIEKNPARVEPYLMLAALQREMNRPYDALVSYKRVLEVNPASVPAYLALGSHYESLGRLPDARESYEAALRLDQDHPLAQNNLAWLLADAENPSPEDLDRALELAQDAKERLPQNPSVADTLGWVMFKKNLPTAAISLFREAIEGYPESSAVRSVVRYHLAQAYELSGERERAIAELKRAIRESPSFAGRSEAEALLERLRRGELSQAAP
jgi:tetratricopeptide (TPR) repeat protein